MRCHDDFKTPPSLSASSASPLYSRQEAIHSHHPSASPSDCAAFCVCVCACGNRGRCGPGWLVSVLHCAHTTHWGCLMLERIRIFHKQAGERRRSGGRSVSILPWKLDCVRYMILFMLYDFVCRKFAQLLSANVLWVVQNESKCCPSLRRRVPDS